MGIQEPQPSWTKQCKRQPKPWLSGQGLIFEIRFNSHRKSGGAYLKGIDGTIGTGARQASATEKVTCDVYCAKEHLRNSKLANFETYSYRTFRSLNAALRWLKSHVCIPGHA